MPTTDAPTPTTPSLAEKAIERLRAYAKGNGLAPEAIELIKANEKTYDVQGHIHLTPAFNISSKTFLGETKNKACQVFPSFLALKEEIEKLRDAFQNGATWLDGAIKELEAMPGHGWGEHESFLSWADHKTIVGATENCPACKGSGQTACHDCHQSGTVPCPYCEGRGQEVCPLCMGRGDDPANPAKPCPTCHGKRFSPCRFCHETGKVVCPTCQGKGSTPCVDCKGIGKLSQEAQISRGATLSFSLGATTELPSGLLRAMDRVGEANIPKGHGDVTMRVAAADSGEDRTRIQLTASIPHADLKITISNRETIISIFGKLHRLMDVPPFLDGATAPARKLLAQAAAGKVPIEKTQTARMMREALNLVLSGKTATNDLRRLYPIGLSPQVAQEIMRNIGLTLKTYTVQARAFVGAVMMLLSGGVFGFVLLGSTFKALTHDLDFRLVRLIEILFPLTAMGLSWLALRHAARWALKSKYPQAKISQTQNIGKVGYSTLAAIAVIYVLLFFLAQSPLLQML